MRSDFAASRRPSFSGSFNADARENKQVHDKPHSFKFVLQPNMDDMETHATYVRTFSFACMSGEDIEPHGNPLKVESIAIRQYLAVDVT